MRSPRPALLCVALAALASGGAVTVTQLAGPDRPATSATLATATTSAQGARAILGSNVRAVVSRLGVPAAASADAATLSFGYTDRFGRLHARAVVFHAGIAVHVAPELSGFGRAGYPPASGAYVGQPVDELAQRSGNPVAVTAAADAPVVELTYADGTRVTVAHGHVIGVGR